MPTEKDVLYKRGFKDRPLMSINEIRQGDIPIKGTATISGIPLTFETRLLAALALQISKPSLDDLAEVSGVKIVRYAERFRVDVERYPTKPLRIYLPKGAKLDSTKDAMVGEIKHKVVMTDQASNSVWVVPVEEPVEGD